MKSWADIGFEIEFTGDESPSLRLLESIDGATDRGETMHHSGGACAETLLIYGEPARRVLQKVQNPHFLVVGLGLGYIELTIAREALLLGLNPAQVGLITSYESVPELREYFVKWLHEDLQNLHPEVTKTYDQVLQSVCRDTELSSADLKIFLRYHFPDVTKVSGALSAEVVLNSKYHGIMYDAFSSKTSPHLWEEEFLNNLLQTGAEEKSLLTTYACKGALKRALKAQGFEVVLREGFQGKRNSTLGLKNL